MTRLIPVILFPALVLSGVLGCASKTRQPSIVDRPLIGYPEQNLKLMDNRSTVWSTHKIGKDEYFPQPNDWTCNASSYLMIYRKLTQKDVPLDVIATRMGAVEGRGAENARVVEVMQALGDTYEVVTGYSSSHPKGQEVSANLRAKEKAGEMETLKNLLREGYLVMINFREPVDGGGHYGVLQGINDEALEIADPYYGLRSIVAWNRFDFRTGFSDPVLHGWYVAIRPRDSRASISPRIPDVSARIRTGRPATLL